MKKLTRSQVETDVLMPYLKNMNEKQQLEAKIHILSIENWRSTD